MGEVGVEPTTKGVSACYPLLTQALPLSYSPTSRSRSSIDDTTYWLFFYKMASSIPIKLYFYRLRTFYISVMNISMARFTTKYNLIPITSFITRMVYIYSPLLSTYNTLRGDNSGCFCAYKSSFMESIPIKS